MPWLPLALSWLTVLPVRVDVVDRSAARGAIAAAPVVGLLLGALAAGALLLLDTIGAPGLVAGLLTVGLLVLLTRGMHVDGLADTADGLGCYGPAERALAVMRSGGVGAFAVVTVVVVLGTQAAAFDALTDDRWPAVIVAVVAGRAAFGLCCLPWIPAARQDGLGALVAGSQPVLVAVAWWLALTAAGVFADLDDPWHGPLAMALAAALVLALAWHARRRLGGITGDVLGAACELATTAVLVVYTL